MMRKSHLVCFHQLQHLSSESSQASSWPAGQTTLGSYRKLRPHHTERGGGRRQCSLTLHERSRPYHTGGGGRRQFILTLHERYYHTGEGRRQCCLTLHERSRSYHGGGGVRRQCSLAFHERSYHTGGGGEGSHPSSSLACPVIWGRRYS